MTATADVPGPLRAEGFRVLIVEDSWVWASAMAHRISGIHGVSWVGTTGDGREALDVAAETAPHVALVDLMLGDQSGLRVAQTLRARQPGLRTLIMTVEPTAAAIAEARKAGMNGFVCKDDLPDGGEVEKLVTQLLHGEEVWSRSVAAIESRAAIGARHGLRDEDIAIIRCFERGFDTAQISRLLCLAPQTILNRTSRIGRRLGVSGRIQILAAARAKGLIEDRPRHGAD